MCLVQVFKSKYELRQRVDYMAGSGILGRGWDAYPPVTQNGVIQSGFS